ncbi:MAG: Bifunctional purine biosynthetic protein ade1 [Pleopsidium flavum]|nr:MAG: Bifunctional purine biosynthetic protein ade1 [Pleopsidium flavum]
MDSTVVTETDLAGTLPLVARGKVRDLYAVDDQTLLFIATDRISAYDVIMKNGIPNKGILLTLLSEFWFSYLSSALPNLRTHFVSLALPARIAPNLRRTLQNRSMQVRKLHIFPIEAIVRGYITGSAWKEYQEKGTVHGMKVKEGLKESEAFPDGPIYSPSTKAEAGQNDENIHPGKAVEIVGEKYATRIEELALSLYKTARDYALERGIIIADTKFEFGLDAKTDEIVLVDEVLTPDSSRFWPASSYTVGETQESFDKQYLRNWLTSKGLKGKPSVEMPAEVVRNTETKYREAFGALVGRKWRDILQEKR